MNEKFGTHKIKNYLSREAHTRLACEDICQPLMVQRSGNLVLDQNLRQDGEEILRWCSGGERPPSCMYAALVIETNIYAGLGDISAVLTHKLCHLTTAESKIMFYFLLSSCGTSDM